MEIFHLAGGHLDLIGSIAIAASLLFTAFELHHVKKAQRITNLLTITRHHREIWSELFKRPELERILEPRPDLKLNPIRNNESLFVTFLILHLKTTFRATKEKMFVKSDALNKDIQWFFSLPIPKEVWEKSKPTQDSDFLAFVERQIHGDADKNATPISWSRSVL